MKTYKVRRATTKYTVTTVKAKDENDLWRKMEDYELVKNKQYKWTPSNERGEPTDIVDCNMEDKIIS